MNTQIEQIKAEIEKIIKSLSFISKTAKSCGKFALRDIFNAQKSAYKDILNCINSLSEEPANNDVQTKLQKEEKNYDS